MHLKSQFMDGYRFANGNRLFLHQLGRFLSLCALPVPFYVLGRFQPQSFLNMFSYGAALFFAPCSRSLGAGLLCFTGSIVLSAGRTLSSKCGTVFYNSLIRPQLCCLALVW